MEHLKTLNHDEMVALEGGIIPAIYGCILAHKAFVAMYGAAKVWGAYTGAAATLYVASDNF